MRWAERPISVTHFQDMMGIGEVVHDKNLALVILDAVVWSVWKARNDWVFNNALIKSPKLIAYKVVGFLIQWTKMQKEKNRSQMEDIILKLQEGLRAAGGGKKLVFLSFSFPLRLAKLGMSRVWRVVFSCFS